MGERPCVGGGSEPRHRLERTDRTLHVLAPKLVGGETGGRADQMQMTGSAPEWTANLMVAGTHGQSTLTWLVFGRPREAVARHPLGPIVGSGAPGSIDRLVGRLHRGDRILGPAA